MQTTLKAKTLDLVRGTGRGELHEIATATGVPYAMLWRWKCGRTDNIDADHCQRVYEHLTGLALEIR